MQHCGSKQIHAQWLCKSCHGSVRTVSISSVPAHALIYFLTCLRFEARDHPWPILHPAMLLSRFREQLRSSEWAEKERVPRTAGLAILQAIASRVDPRVSA